MSSAPEQVLAIRASRGDIEAFRLLVEEHSGLVYRVALRILGLEDAQDASQEVWIRVWRNIKNFRGDSAFSTWLYRITVNTCLSVRRKEARRGEREYSGEKLPFLPEPHGATPTRKRPPSARRSARRYRRPSATYVPNIGPR